MYPQQSPPTPSAQITSESNVSRGSKQKSSNNDTTVAGVVKCQCNSLEDKETIQCSNCSIWQHVNCFYNGLGNLYSSVFHSHELIAPTNSFQHKFPSTRMQDRAVLDGGQVDQDKLYDYVNVQLGVDLIALRIDPAHFSHHDSDYGNEGFPLLFDHGCAVGEWKQFQWIHSDTGSATDKNTKETHGIGIKFVYADLPTTGPFTGPFTGFAWLVIQPKNGQQSLSLERVVLALDVSRSRNCWPDNQEIQELRNLTRLCQLLQQLAHGIQRKLCPLNGRYTTKDNILLSFALPEFSFAKLEEGAEFDTLSSFEVLGRLRELEQEGFQVSEAPGQHQTTRSSRLRNNFAVQQATPEPESEPDSIRLVKVARLSPFPLQLLSDQLRSLHGSQKANFPEEPMIDDRRIDHVPRNTTCSSQQTPFTTPLHTKTAQMSALPPSRNGDFAVLPQPEPSIHHQDPETCIYLHATSLLPPNNLLDYRLQHDRARKIIVYKFMRFHKYWPNGQQTAVRRSTNRSMLAELLTRLKLGLPFLERLQFFLRNMYDKFTALNLIQHGEYDPATISWLDPQWDGDFQRTKPSLPRVTRSLRVSRSIVTVPTDKPPQSVVFPARKNTTRRSGRGASLRSRSMLKHGLSKPAVYQDHAQTLPSLSGLCAKSPLQLGIGKAPEGRATTIGFMSIATQGGEVKDSQDSSGQILQMRELAMDRTLIDEQLFRIQLTALASFHKVENINFNPLICDQTVQLFQLWQIVKGIGSDKLDWTKGWVWVATILGFNKDREVAAAEELRICYNQLLKDLEDIKDDSDEEPDWLNSSHLYEEP